MLIVDDEVWPITTVKFKIPLHVNNGTDAFIYKENTTYSGLFI